MKTITLGSNPNGSSTRRPSYNIEVIPAPDDPTPSPLAPGTSSSADPRGLKRKRSEGEPGPRVVPTPAAASLKYRKPELAIRVDFWNFTQRRAKEKYVYDLYSHRAGSQTASLGQRKQPRPLRRNLQSIKQPYSVNEPGEHLPQSHRSRR